MAAPAPSVFAVLSLGAFSGGIVKGITGFGNAIINLLVWVAFTAAGVNGGPLRLAVLADSIGCMVYSIPLLLMTSAHKTADWRLVVAMLLFASAGAPLGAALLTHLDARWVELVMACVLLLVICLHVKLHETLTQKWRQRRDKRRSAVYGGLLADHDATDQRSDCCGPGSPKGSSGNDGVNADAALHSVAVDSLPSLPPSQLPSLQTPAILLGGAIATSSPDGAGYPDRDRSCHAYDSNTGSSERLHLLRDSTAGALTPTKTSACACSELGAVSALIADRASGDPHVKAPAAVVAVTACCQNSVIGTARCKCAPKEACFYDKDDAVASAGKGGDGMSGCAPECAVVGADMQSLLGADTLASEEVSRPVLRCRSCAGDVGGDESAGDGASSPLGGNLGPLDARARLRRWLARQDWLEMRRIFLVGSVAGFASGVMGGMTGIGGPPIMFMYEKLKVAKEVVRGTNAIINVLQVRLISYVIMGVFQRQDLPLYAVTSLFGLMGVFLGNSLAGRLDQKGFSRVLVALMIICCALLFVSAAGLA